MSNTNKYGIKYLNFKKYLNNQKSLDNNKGGSNLLITGDEYYNRLLKVRKGELNLTDTPEFLYEHGKEKNDDEKEKLTDFVNSKLNEAENIKEIVIQSEKPSYLSDLGKNTPIDNVKLRHHMEKLENEANFIQKELRNIEKKNLDSNTISLGLLDKEIKKVEVIEDFNLDELMKLYSTTEIEDNKEIKETSKLISKAINDKNWEKKVSKVESNYNDSLDNSNYDSVFEQVYNKVYITSQYIFPDDTIKNIRNKIATSIPLNPKFEKDFKFLPEYQYFWSEYTMNKKKDKIMLGQKWIRRNELLQIDIQPNENIKVYENLRDNLNYLRDSFGYKIKREDDENLILRDYDDYITNNEIFMLDLLNDIGTNYNVESEKMKNVYDVYVNIYFPMINYERFEKIVQHLNNKNNTCLLLIK